MTFVQIRSTAHYFVLIPTILYSSLSRGLGFVDHNGIAGHDDYYFLKLQASKPCQ